MKVSFIIPHYGRFSLLIDTVSSLIKLDFPKDEYEIIIVSQNSELSLDIFTGLDLAKVNLYILVYSGQSISAQRNFGFAKSRGEYIAFIDADIDLSANWINSMIQELSKSDVVIASAVQTCKNEENGKNEVELVRVALSNLNTDCDVDFLPGGNLFMKRITVEMIGGFPEHLKTCEDYYFTDKAASLGRLRYISSSSFVHLGEDQNYGMLWAKEIWRGQSNLLALKGRRVKLKELPSIIAPICIFVFFIALIFSLLNGNFSFVFLFIFLISIIPIAYSVRLKILAPYVSWSSVIKFYCTYWPARAIGSVVGVIKSFDLRK